MQKLDLTTVKKTAKRYYTIVAKRLQEVWSRFVNVVKELISFLKGQHLTEKQRDKALKQRNNVILGIGQLLVVVSIAYSTSVILIGVDSLESKIALLPQVVFALATLIKAFSKLYK